MRGMHLSSYMSFIFSIGHRAPTCDISMSRSFCRASPTHNHLERVVLYMTQLGEYYTVKSQLSERRLSETTGLFEDDGQSQLFSLLSIAIKLPIIRISIIRKIQLFEVIRRS